MTRFSKTLTSLATAVTLGLAAVAAPQPARADCVGCAIGAGIIGGLAVGAIIGSAAASGPYYYGPGPAYYGPRRHYGPACYWTRHRVWTDGGWRWRRARVCD